MLERIALAESKSPSSGGRIVGSARGHEEAFRR